MKTHKLKTLPKFFVKVLDGSKNFEVRLNDRNFEIGDLLILEEYENGLYSGRILEKIVKYILSDKDFEGVKDDYVVLALE